MHRPTGAGSGRGRGLPLQLPSEPADAELHDGGLSCGCQLTTEERKQAWEEFVGQLDSLDLDAGIRSGEPNSPATPRNSALPRGGGSSRRRSSSPGTSTGVATLDIADGEDDDLTGRDGGYDMAHTLTIAVHAVRTYLARREGEHQQPTDPKHLFCSWCGVRRAEAGRWTS